MAKSNLEKALEKQTKAAQKAAKEEKIRVTAQAVVDGAASVNGFRIMDQESEDLLTEMLRQYDGNEDNCVNFDIGTLPRHLQESINVGYEKLRMYGVISGAMNYISGARVTLSESGKAYFQHKQDAYEQDKGQAVNDTKGCRKEYDVFISHASQDKLEYVDSLYNSLLKLGIKIWYDTNVLSWGDNFKERILEGTQKSEFAIIVISKSFFGKEWTEKELNKFLQRQNKSGQKIILPLLYDITLEDLQEHYPDLADIQVLFTGDVTEDEVVIFFAKELIKRLKE